MTLGSPVRPDAATLIDLAERATQMSAGQWSVMLLERAFPQARRDDILALPVGTRDRLVLALRQTLVAGPMRAEPVCGACGETYEIAIDPSELGLGGEAPWADPGARTVRVGDTPVALRPVCLGDVLSIEAVADPVHAARLLAARVAGEAAAGLPAAALGEALEALDPAADVWIATECHECGAGQSVAFDPVPFVARELHQLAQGVLRDVVDIARAFHWSERDILALSDRRRAFYVAEALA